MSMTDWAKREVEIACKREKENNEEDGMWDYGCACYESALKAYNSLMEDGHSGYSIGMTKYILMRLIDGRPLTPIEDTDDIWNEVSLFREGEKSYQCKRMYSLFKRVKEDGTVRYRDNDRYYCIDVNHPRNTYTNGLVGDLIDEMFPIEMPYCPGDPIKVYCEELLTDFDNGDFDTVGILHAVKGDEKIDIYRYYKESGSGWEEITAGEYTERKKLHKDKFVEAEE